MDNKKIGQFEVTDTGIYLIVDVGEDFYESEMIIPKETFIDAYKKYIEENVRRGTGHWIVGDGCREVYAMEYECSECGNNVIGGGDFCKWCGAKMEGTNESQTCKVD